MGQFLLKLRFPLYQRFVPLEKLVAVDITVELPLDNALFDTVVIDIVTAIKPPQVDHPRTATHHTLHIVLVEVQLLVRV